MIEYMPVVAESIKLLNRILDDIDESDKRKRKKAKEIYEKAKKARKDRDYNLLALLMHRMREL